MICPCGGKSFDTCCGKFISGKKVAKTVEEMMRSRYSAYATGNIEYIYKTMHPKDQADFDFKAAEEWSKESKWLGFEIIRSKEGTANDQTGVIEFIARYEINGKIETHHELSTFEKIEGKWYFADGKLVREPIVNAGEKIGRNADCPCGSGKKYKKCCG